MQLLSEAIPTSGGLAYAASQLSADTQKTLAVFQMMTEMRREIGEECFSRYVISMAHAASHVLEVMLLAAQTGLVGRIGGQWYCHIGVSTLFEIIADWLKSDKHSPVNRRTDPMSDHPGPMQRS